MPTVASNSAEARKARRPPPSRLQKRLVNSARETAPAFPPIVREASSSYRPDSWALQGKDESTVAPSSSQETKMRRRAGQTSWTTTDLGFYPVDREFERVGYDIEAGSRARQTALHRGEGRMSVSPPLRHHNEEKCASTKRMTHLAIVCS
jgi:hypothetical protein